MPRVQVLDSEGTKVGTATLKPEVFEAEVNGPLLHMAIVAHLARARSGSADTRTRAEVRGGGAKPYRQKGTGRARQGSIRSPHYRHGGVVFGPHPRDYDIKMPKKMRRLALRSALSAKLAERNIIVVDELRMESVSTKRLVEILDSLGAEGKTLLVLGEPNDTVAKSARNIPWVGVRVAPSISTYDLLNADQLVLTRRALKSVQEVCAK